MRSLSSKLKIGSRLLSLPFIGRFHTETSVFKLSHPPPPRVPQIASWSRAPAVLEAVKPAPACLRERHVGRFSTFLLLLLRASFPAEASCVSWRKLAPRLRDTDVRGKITPKPTVSPCTGRHPLTDQPRQTGRVPLNPHPNPRRQVLPKSPPFFRWENQGSETLSRSPGSAAC